MSKVIITSNFEQTQMLGFEFANKLSGGEVLALYGDLGSGKTTFMQGLAKGLGIKRNIISPTFIIIRTYTTDLQERETSFRNLYHLDLYRLENGSQASELGLEELFNDPQNVVAIEWPDKIEKLLPEKRINIYFTYLTDKKRQIQIG
jgi:tRNA threonylcarbamoyladenosine biosynthesis protein TsaE